MKRIIFTKGLIVVFAIAIASTLNAGSFYSPADTTSDTPAEHKIISVAYIPEWEPGLPRSIRQISIDDSGHGQVAERLDGILVNLTVFRYQQDMFNVWSKAAVSALSTLYLSTELEDQDIVVEGNPESYKFYFLYPNYSKIIDAEPGYAKTPESLTKLADQLNHFSRDAQVLPLQRQHFIAQPFGAQQSKSILKRISSLPTVADVRQALNEPQHVVIDKPTWLIEISLEDSLKLKNNLGVAPERDFFYATTPQGMVLKMELVSTE